MRQGLQRAPAQLHGRQARRYHARTSDGTTAASPCRCARSGRRAAARIDLADDTPRDGTPRNPAPPAEPGAAEANGAETGTGTGTGTTPKAAESVPAPRAPRWTRATARRRSPRSSTRSAKRRRVGGTNSAPRRANAQRRARPKPTPPRGAAIDDSPSLAIEPIHPGYGRVRAVIESRVVHPLARDVTTPFAGRPAVKEYLSPPVPSATGPLPRRPSRTTRRAVVPRSVRLTFTRVVHEGSSTVYRLLARSIVRALSSLSRVSVARRRFRHPRRRVATGERCTTPPILFAHPRRRRRLLPGFSPRDQLRAGPRLRLGRYPRKTFLQHVQHFDTRVAVGALRRGRAA